jgi:ABC-type lipoprotein release transport system permease subunit
MVPAIREMIGNEDVDVLSWREVMPNLAQVIELNDYVLLIINAIVFVVVAISIMNVILVSVIERTSELGIILAIGAKRRYVIWMVLAQGLIISMIGSVIGIILGCGVVQYFNGHGLDLARFERGFSSFIGGTVLYPILSFDNVVGSALWFLAITVLVSLYPAIMAARLMPVEAIRKG